MEFDNGKLDHIPLHELSLESLAESGRASLDDDTGSFET